MLPVLHALTATAQHCTLEYAAYGLSTAAPRMNLFRLFLRWYVLAYDARSVCFCEVGCSAQVEVQV